ncbi:DUF2065 domain-containing protein [Desulfovibrio sp. Fe33]|uniref:DUF2065 domain-containing protein n=1 Tax=Desulfovibrio sp. Fe33 TaxID=3020842 RepID=UPI003FA4AEB4
MRTPIIPRVDTGRVLWLTDLMNIDWSLLIAAVGLALVFEGIPYFLFAERMPGLLARMAVQPPKFLRFIGLVAIILGLLVISFGRSLSL